MPFLLYGALIPNPVMHNASSSLLLTAPNPPSALDTASVHGEGAPPPAVPLETNRTACTGTVRGARCQTADLNCDGIMISLTSSDRLSQRVLKPLS